MEPHNLLWSRVLDPVLPSHKKEGNLTFCNSMDGPGDYYAK